METDLVRVMDQSDIIKKKDHHFSQRFNLIMLRMVLEQDISQAEQ